jgi:hypothetical protein
MIESKQKTLYEGVFNLIDQQCPLRSGEVMAVAISVLAKVYAMMPPDQRAAMADDVLQAVLDVFSEVDATAGLQ